MLDFEPLRLGTDTGKGATATAAAFPFPLFPFLPCSVEKLGGAASVPVQLEEAGADDANENDSGRRLFKCSRLHVPAPGGKSP